MREPRIRHRDIVQNAKGFEIYQHLNERYSKHLWLAADDFKLNAVWKPIEEVRLAQLEKAQAQARAQDKRWGAWHLLNPDEARQYRYTRLALEILEEAHLGVEREWVTRITFDKWEAVADIWANTSWFPFVYEDSEPRLRKSFCAFLNAHRRVED